MSQDVKIEEGVPFQQVRLMILLMEAAKAKNQQGMERIRREAAQLGIVLETGNQAA